MVTVGDLTSIRGRVLLGDRYLDSATDGALPGPLELLAQSNGHTYGRFVLDPTPRRSGLFSGATGVATVLAGQAAAALTD